MVERALGGSKARKFRAVLPDFALKGEKVVLTAVRYLVIIFTGDEGRGYVVRMVVLVDGVAVFRGCGGGAGEPSDIAPVDRRRYGGERRASPHE